MLELRGLKKTYLSKKGTDCTALNDVNLSFGNTGLVFILGRSGSGKSTLMNAIGGLDSTDSGEIIINGTSNKDFSHQDFDSFRNTYVGFIFQEYNLMPEFNVYDNVALASELQNRPADKNAILSLISEIGLDGLAKRKVSELSGGQKQRVSIARALSKNPNIILADEPTGNLDKKTSDQIFSLLKELSKTKLILVVTHDHESAHRFGDRVVTFSDGTVCHDTQNFSSSFTSPLLKNKSTSKEKLTLKQAKLPSKTAFRIAVSSVLNKKLRLMLTILLTVVSVSLFGFGQIISNYDPQLSGIYTLENAGDTSLLVRKGSLHNTHGTPQYDFDAIPNTTIDYVKDNYPQFEFSEMIAIDGYNYYVDDKTASSYLAKPISGFIISSKEKLADLGYDFYGTYPVYDNEIALNESIAFLLMCFAPEVFNSALGTNASQTLPILIAMDMINSLDEATLQSRFNMDKADVIATISTLGDMEFDKDGTVDIPLLNNPALCEFVFKGFSQSFLKYVTEITLTDNVYKITGICGNNIGSILPYVLHNKLSAENITMEQYNFLYNFENIYSYIFVGKTFATTYFADGMRTAGFYASKTYKSDGTNMLQNMLVKCNAEWLASNPDIGEPIIIDGQTYVMMDNGVTLKDNECIVSSTYFESTFGNMDKFDTTLPLNASPYGYVVNLRFLASKTYVERYKKDIKIVGVFDYYDAVSNYTEHDQYSAVAEVDRGYVKDNMTKLIFVPDKAYNKIIPQLLMTGTLWGNMFGSAKEQLSFWNDVGDFSEDGMMLYHANPTSEGVQAISDYLSIVTLVFNLMGYLMGAFSIALMCNFMSVSVMGKKREIGILRALGSRKADVLKIFLFESFLIGIVTVILTMVGIVGLTYGINEAIRFALAEFVNATIVDYIAIFTLSATPFIYSTLMIAFIITLATAIPVLKISNMKPIDAIKT